MDAITSGNHVWKHREVYARLDSDPRILRPANYPSSPKAAPGRGSACFTLDDGRRLALLNIQGTTFMEPLPCPFQAASAWVEQLDALKTGSISVRLVDFHAEASSEKKAMAWMLDGRVSAVMGTHTHVQTADACIFPKGTAYITDLGMCGVELSALGMDAGVALNRFLTRRPASFKAASGTAAINGVFLDIDDYSGLAREIRLVRLDTPPSVRGA